MMLLDPDQVVEEIRPHLTTLPACIAGSVVASGTYGLPVTSDADIDVFCYTEQALISCIQKLVDHHFQIDERNERVWQRWLRYGLSGWHTNSLKLRSPSDSEVNLVYKTVGRVPMNSLASVLESFDFGLLGRGYDLYTQEWRDMRTFLFPDYDIEGPLPLMPSKRDGWRSGFISQYNGLREAGRYAKYHSRGFDLTLVKDDLVTGYYEIAGYMRYRGDRDRTIQAEIYETIARKILDDKIDELLQSAKVLPTLDSLDQILQAVE